MNVFAFYNPIHRDPLWDEADQRALIGLWDKSWRKHGWTPRLVNEDTAMLHPRYAQFYEKYHALPSGYGTDFDVACMMRYVAVAAKQEPMSMLSDYDVINYGFTPEDANRIAAKSEEANLVFFSSPDAANCGATLGPWKLFEALSEVFEGPTVVITHFAPSLRSADPRYGLTPGTAGFCNALDHLLPKADVWLHGHLHCAQDYVHHSCRVLANPFGYARKNEQVKFDPLKTVRVDG